MREFAQRLTEAIEASGKSQVQIAKEAKIATATLNRLKQGRRLPKTDVLVRIAKATNTTIGYLLGDPDTLSNRDYRMLGEFREWIDGRLPKTDAREEPNAILLKRTKLDKVADEPRPQEIPLQATDDSMIGDAIRANDTLYALPAEAADALGKVVACRLAGAVYVKRLVEKNGRRFLESSNPRYTAIAIEDADQFEMGGVECDRTGDARLGETGVALGIAQPDTAFELVAGIGGDDVDRAADRIAAVERSLRPF